MEKTGKSKVPKKEMWRKLIRNGRVGKFPQHKNRKILGSKESSTKM